MVKISGNIIDIINRRIFKGTVVVKDRKIHQIREEDVKQKEYILPGLIDSHIHIESSMLVPSEFARLAVVHGTVATVSDPHEIANVLGVDGIRFMIQNGQKVPFKFYFGASSCVPATVFETSGAELGASEIESLLKMDEIKYLSEMMNFPGVLYNDDNVWAKINLAKKYNKPIDGHAPGLKGDDARKYIAAGISTDHECFTLEEALDKISFGMKIQIREGSAAKNFDTLIGLLNNHSDRVMFCSDDRHPNDLARGHINTLVKRALHSGYDPITVLRSCVLNPVSHYNLDVGLLQPADPADFIVVDNLSDFNILETYIDGIKVAENGKPLFSSVKETTPNKFNAEKISTNDILVQATGKKIKVQKAIDGQLITESYVTDPKVVEGFIVSDVDRDILKMVVVNRYSHQQPALNFINNFGFIRGAIASSVAHDSHNIIAVGTNDEDIVNAINLLIEHKGGVSLAHGKNRHVLPLPVAGLMSNEDGYKVAKVYENLSNEAKAMGSGLHAPYMTLSFMALLVIPALKLSDKGLFDGNSFSFTSLFVK